MLFLKPRLNEVDALFEEAMGFGLTKRNEKEEKLKELHKQPV